MRAAAAAAAAPAAGSVNCHLLDSCVLTGN
jgi:hypothetical protein